MNPQIYITSIYESILFVKSKTNHVIEKVPSYYGYPLIYSFCTSIAEISLNLALLPGVELHKGYCRHRPALEFPLCPRNSSVGALDQEENKNRQEANSSVRVQSTRNFGFLKLWQRFREVGTVVRWQLWQRGFQSSNIIMKEMNDLDWALSLFSSVVGFCFDSF